MSETEIILTNKARCMECDDVIESTHVHDYVTCSCGALSVDGGLDYLKRSFKNETMFEELSEHGPPEDLVWTTAESKQHGPARQIKLRDIEPSHRRNILKMFEDAGYSGRGIHYETLLKLEEEDE